MASGIYIYIYIYIYTTNDCTILLLTMLKVNRRHMRIGFTPIPANEFNGKLKIITQESYTLYICL
jgi:hypothetical protein